MSLAAAFAKVNKPVGVALIGAGKFATMFLNQVQFTPMINIVAIADLDVSRARKAVETVGWTKQAIDRTVFTTQGKEVIQMAEVEVVVEATGNPTAGVRHAMACLENGKHIIMVNVEADALVGPLLSRHFRARNLIYSLAYGDQPALISELIDWASSIGMEIVAAGKGTKHREEFHWSTPDTVWEWYGIKREDAVKGGMNAKMFNSFLDGTKSAIEMAAVANACLLSVPSDGLLFPPCPTYKLPSLLKPKSDGGLLEKLGIVEVVSSLHPDGSQVDQDLRWGVYVVFKARNEYARACFREYGLQTDDSGWYASMYKPYHLIGLELGISVLNAALRKEATGSAVEWRGDVASVAKKDMEPGDELDGEGGYTVFGKLLPAEKSLEIGALPIGLAHGVRLVKGVKKGEVVTWAHVEEMKGDVVEMRREMESEFGKAKANGV